MQELTRRHRGAARVVAVAGLVAALAGCTKEKTATPYVPQSWSISGTVTDDGTGAARPGVTVKLLGTSRSTVSQSNGTWTIAGLPNGTYTVEASLTGYAFLPPTQSVTVSNASVTGVNFTARLGIGIAGRVTGPMIEGVTVTLTGPSPATTTTTATTAADGTYSFIGVLAGTYTVTPSLAGGWTFSPANSLVTITTESVTGPNFGSISPTHAISGAVSGAVVANVTVTLSGDADAVTVTDASGNYSFTGLLPGTYGVAASREGYAFTPGALAVTVTDADVTGRNFAAAALHRIAGWVTGDVVAGVAVTLATPTGTVLAEATTDELGYFELPGVDGAYDVAPSLAGYAFTPTHQAVTLAGADATNLAFAAAATPVPAYAVSGKITGDVLKGVTLALVPTDGASTTASATSDATGAFAFAAVEAGDYMLIPAIEDYDFAPASRLVSVRTANVANQDFAASLSPTARIISGTVSGDVVAGVSVTLTGISPATAPQTVKTGADGTFRFRALADGVYSVVPSSTGFLFTPADCLVTIAGPSVTYVAFGSAYAPHSISGKVSGAVAAGVTVTLTGGAADVITTTGTDGSYAFAGLASGTYTVIPSLTGYAFGPAEATVVLEYTDVTAVDFVAAPAFRIAGLITGAKVEGVTVTLGGAKEATFTTTATGAFEFTGLVAGTYFVTPSLSGYTFAPQSLPIALTADVTDANFTSTLIPTWSVSGTITGAPGLAVTVSLSGTAAGSQSTSTGTYLFTGLSDGSYMVIPSLAGYAFTPASRAFHVNGADVGAQDFAASPAP